MIEYLWPTPILTLDAPFDADQLSELLAYSTGKAAYKRANPPVNKLPEITSIKLRGHYNLFDAKQEVGAPEVWHVFRRWVDTTYRAFLLDAHGVNNADDLDIVARCIVGHYTPGMRTPPHYHHTCDHVLCLYLDCGQDRPSRDTLTREKGDGELVLQDPRPMAGFPFWEKTKYIYTMPGLAVLHPSRVWHETNPFVGTGHRSLLAVTLRVASHNYGDLYVNL